jgi:hypothetical protein
MSLDLPTAHYVTALRDLIHVFADDDRMSATQETFAEQARETLHYAAERLEKLDAAMPACPTCGGTGTLGERDYFADHADPCPDCLSTPGRMSPEWCAAIVARVFKFADEERHQHGGEYGEGWRACIDHLRAIR